MTNVLTERPWQHQASSRYRPPASLIVQDRRGSQAYICPHLLLGGENHRHDVDGQGGRLGRVRSGLFRALAASMNNPYLQPLSQWETGFHKLRTLKSPLFWKSSTLHTIATCLKARMQQYIIESHAIKPRQTRQESIWI